MKVCFTGLIAVFNWKKQIYLLNLVLYLLKSKVIPVRFTNSLQKFGV